ncbi:MAG TPA: hypothetical protein VIT62_06015 [Lysobacter sp.]
MLRNVLALAFLAVAGLSPDMAHASQHGAEAAPTVDPAPHEGG